MDNLVKLNMPNYIFLKKLRNILKLFSIFTYCLEKKTQSSFLLKLFNTLINQTKWEFLNLRLIFAIEYSHS